VCSHDVLAVRSVTERSASALDASAFIGRASFPILSGVLQGRAHVTPLPDPGTTARHCGILRQHVVGWFGRNTLTRAADRPHRHARLPPIPAVSIPPRGMVWIKVGKHPRRNRRRNHVAGPSCDGSHDGHARSGRVDSGHAGKRAGLLRGYLRVGRRDRRVRRPSQTLPSASAS
jgi:hypothetical protein